MTTKKKAATEELMELLTVETVLKADEPTRNGRVYPRAMLQAALTEYLKGDARLGVFESSGDLWRERVGVSLSRVSHRVHDVGIAKDGRLVASIELLDTPSGQRLREALRLPEAVECTPVGLGAVRDNVVSDFVLESVSFYPVEPPKTEPPEGAVRLTEKR